jgi:hypothetical protein
MWIVDGSTIEHLVFGVALTRDDTRPVSVTWLLVAECYAPDSVKDRIRWELQAGPDGPSKFRQIEYGREPRSYRARVAARALQPSSCYYARFRKSRGSYPEAGVIFLTDSIGRIAPIDGLALERLKLPGSEPASLPDTATRTRLSRSPGDVIQAVRQVFMSHGFRIAASDSATVLTDQLKLGATWESSEVAERIDCGRWVEGTNRVHLPLSSDSAGGYGHLLVTLRARIHSASSGTILDLDPDVWLNPPWFEQGNRPMMKCGIHSSFAVELLKEIHEVLSSSHGGA